MENNLNIIPAFCELPPKNLKILRDSLKKIFAEITDEDEKRQLATEIAKLGVLATSK